MHAHAWMPTGAKQWMKKLSARKQHGVQNPDTKHLINHFSKWDKIHSELKRLQSRAQWVPNMIQIGLRVKVSLYPRFTEEEEKKKKTEGSTLLPDQTAMWWREDQRRHYYSDSPYWFDSWAESSFDSFDSPHRAVQKLVFFLFVLLCFVLQQRNCTLFTIYYTLFGSYFVHYPISIPAEINNINLHRNSNGFQYKLKSLKPLSLLDNRNGIH